MARSVDVQLVNDKFGNLSVPASRFPAKCVVCLEPATKEYALEKTFNYGRRVIPVKAYLPMCDAHYEKASYKSPAEKFLGGIGAVVGGLLVGILGAWLAGRPWDAQFHMGLVASAFLALIFAAIAWYIIFYYASAFADPASKQVRDAVKVTSYHPGKHTVRLDFEQDQIADSLQ